MSVNNIPRLSFGNLTSKAQVQNPVGLPPRTPSTQKGNKFNIGNTLGSIAGTVGGFLGGPVGWIGLGIQAVGDNIKAAKSQFDLEGMQNSINDFSNDFNQFAGSADNSSDILNLASMAGNNPFIDEINNSGYSWDGNILSGIGALIGNAATERDKQSARDAVSKMQIQQGIALDNAITTVGNKDYRRRMANFFNSAAFGGSLNTHGADFSDDIIRIDAGGTHEQNPLGGVPAGMDSNGLPNLVEEGERIWDDYVFSDRLKMPKGLINKYKLGGRKNKSLTFAEGVDKISDKLGTELRPNDPITKRTKDAILGEFEEAQEEKRIQQEKRDLLKAMAEMTPEEFASLIQPASQVPAEEIPIEEQVPPQEVSEEPMGFEQDVEIPGMAFGGHLFKQGGRKEKLQKAIDDGSLKYDAESGTYSGIVKGIGRVTYNKDSLNKMGVRTYKMNKEEYKQPDDTFYDASISPNLRGLQTFGRARVNGVYLPMDNYIVPEGIAEKVTTKAPEKKAPAMTGRPVNTVRTPMIPDWTAGLDAQADAILGMTPDIPEYSVNIKDTPITVSKMDVPVIGAKRPEFEMLPTWMRYAPAIGGGLAVLSDMFGNPNYSGAENLISASRRLSSPVDIPVTTINNRMRRNPFDERLMSNQANQNLAAGLRSTLDTAGGNRAFRQYATSQLVRDNQGAKAELARNAYLANRQDALQTAEFNRQTDLYNMNALNQNSLAEAQLNSDRQMRGFEARRGAQSYLDTLRMQDDQIAAGDMTAFLTSLGNIGNENEQRNWLTSLANEGILNYTLGKDGNIDFISSKNGGKIKTKKRRF